MAVRSTRRSLDKVIKKCGERRLFTDDRNPFVIPIYNFWSLAELELASHEKLDVSVLSHEGLRHLSLLNIKTILHTGNLCLSSIKRLVIDGCGIYPETFRAFMLQETLVDLEMTRTEFSRPVRGETIVEMLTMAKGLRRIRIEGCRLEEDLYYIIASRLRELNSFCFASGERSISFDVTVAGPSEVIFRNFDPSFYAYDFRDARNIVCLDDFVVSANLARLSVQNITGFSAESVSIDKSLVDEFLLRLRRMEKLSLRKCFIDGNLLYKVLKKFRDTLRHLDVTGTAVPFDFVNVCRSFLRKCHVAFGPIAKDITGAQKPSQRHLSAAGPGER